MLAPKLSDSLAKRLNDKIIDCRLFSHGQAARIYLLDTQSGMRAVLKQLDEDADEALIRGEVFAYQYLRENTSLRAPEVLMHGPDYFVMEYIESGGPATSPAEEQAAQALAALHSIKGKRYGFETETPIGPYLQNNEEQDGWVKFFRDQRLMEHATKAHREQAIDSKLFGQIEKLAGRLENYIGKGNPPSLIHGDVWSGNVLLRGGRLQAFIDPACYFADPDIELAFIQLFNTFHDRFWRTYAEIRPFNKAILSDLSDLYNIYPLLIHVRLYGGSYIGSLKEHVGRFVR